MKLAVIALINNERHIKKLIFLGFVLLLLLHLVLVFGGLYDDDDTKYTFYAANAAFGDNHIPVTSHFQLRWTTVYATAFFFAIFGINAVAAGLFSSICYILCGVIIHKILKDKNLFVYCTGLILFLFSRAVILNTHRTLADAAICLSVLSMYYFYRTWLEKQVRPVVYGSCFALALFFGIISKETIVLALPLFAILFTRDLFKRTNSAFWKYALLFSGAIIFLYGCYFKITTGDFLYRYHILIANSYLNECSYNLLPVAATVSRITYKLWHALLLNGDFLVLIPAIAAFVYRKKMALNAAEKTDHLSFVMLLLAANFMTITPLDYVPMCPAWRHFVYLLPFAAITAAPFTRQYIKDPGKFILLPALYILATVIVFITGGGNIRWCYLSIAVLFTCIHIISFKKNIPAKFLFFGILLVFSTIYLTPFIKPLYPYHSIHEKMITHYFTDSNKKTIVYDPDFTSSHAGRFYRKYKKDNVSILLLDSLKPGNGEALYLFVNAQRSRKVYEIADSLQATGSFKNVQKLYSEGGIYLFEADSLFLKEVKNKADARKPEPDFLK